MGSKKTITLSEEEIKYLKKIISTGKNSANAIAHAHILLKSNEGWENEDIAKALDVSIRMLQRVRKKYNESGIKGAVFRKKQSNGPKRKLDGEQEARLIQIACSKAPDGHAKWSLRMLSNRMVELDIVDSLSYETVRQTLKKTNLSLT